MNFIRDNFYYIFCDCYISIRPRRIGQLQALFKQENLKIKKVNKAS
jgi:hypothetical protein